MALFDDLDGWHGSRREAQEREDLYIIMTDFMFLYGGNQHNIVKQLSSN